MKHTGKGGGEGQQFQVEGEEPEAPLLVPNRLRPRGFLSGERDVLRSVREGEGASEAGEENGGRKGFVVIRERAKMSAPASPEAKTGVTEVEIPEKNLKQELGDTFMPWARLLIENDDPFEDYRGKTVLQKIVHFLFWAFPMLEWLSTYKTSYIIGDIVGGLTITSLAVPQVSQISKPMRLD